MRNDRASAHAAMTEVASEPRADACGQVLLFDRIVVELVLAPVRAA